MADRPEDEHLVQGGTSVMRLMFAVVAGWILSTAAISGGLGAADSILLNFSSPNCPPCQTMKPTLAELERTGIPVRHVDIFAEPHLAARYGIRKTPTFVVVSSGKEVTRLVGSQTLQSLQAALAIDPSGPLIPTGTKSRSLDEIPAPQTRLAPVGGVADAREQTLISLATPPLSEPMPSLSLADAVQRARAATVRLRVHDGHGYGAGTGTIIDTHGDEALVLTCGHLFRENKGQGKVEVDLFVGGQTHTVLGQVVDYDADVRDIALVAIRPGFPVQPVKLHVTSQRVENGQTAFSFGCDRGADPSRRDTRITGINKYNQHLGVSNLEIAGAPIDGRSGGGLFDSNGRLIGVCNAADYKDDVGIYAGPGNIKWQLDRVGLAHLFDSPSSNTPPTVPAASPASHERLASLNHNVVVPTAAATSPPARLEPAASEVIVIVRDRNNPNAESRVMTLRSPSNDLMRMIESQAR